jgi:two-component system sensor histidine kinase HydH
MSPHDWLSVAACTGHLGLACLVLLRRWPSPLALPIALLSVDLFGWNFADLAYSVSGAPVWHYVDRALSPFGPPLVLHVVAVFVGRLRQLRPVLLAAYLFAIVIAIWIGQDVWDSVLQVGIAVTMSLAVVLLLLHLRRADDHEERTRTRLFLAAAVIGGVLGSTDLWTDRVPLPSLGNVATFASTALVATVALRFRLFGKEIASTFLFYAGGLAVLGVLGYLAVFLWLGGWKSAALLGGVTVGLALWLTAREARHALTERHRRTEHAATVSRFSEQLAHDLKNPLAALHGALQFLKKEHARGQSLDGHSEFLELMGEQVARLRRIIDDYQRIGRVEPARRMISINDLVLHVLQLEPFAAANGVQLEAALGEQVECEADWDLLSAALENLIRNAFEAMPEGGTITVRTEACTSPRAQVILAVEDQGVGLDARQIERAFDDFYTTKASGSGLGLAFVRRVARAHGGDVSLTSRVGIGTEVRLRIPARVSEKQ